VSDLLLSAWTALLVEAARRDAARRGASEWRPGEKLRLLLAGYNGARNTGSDVRVEEIVRQLEQVLGADRIEIAVMTQDFARTRGYFGSARQVRLPDVFPPFLAREVPQHHGVIACEGSMFKSRFADALTTMMIGALGIAAARNQLAVGYGAEAGEMSPTLRRMVRRYCDTALVVTRNEESERILRALRVRVEPGTDTAWTFEPAPPEVGERLLRQAGWDGHSKVVGICPINPFWWPVRPSLPKALARRLTGAYRASHYRSLYFHRSGAAVDAAYERYLGEVAGAVDDFRRSRGAFPVLVAMERLDADACRRLAARLHGAPVFTSDEHDMRTLVSVLRACSLIASSRYHAVVTTMPALVPSLGVTMDERLRNLMADRGHEDLCLEADDPELGANLRDGLDVLDRDADAIRPGIGRSVARNLRRMARMGFFLEREVARRFPEFPARRGIVAWREYLPPLSEALQSVLVAFDEGEEEPRPYHPSAVGGGLGVPGEDPASR
jgi:polysaccharide pyruvyl transferase WcaK-like protein